MLFVAVSAVLEITSAFFFGEEIEDFSTEFGELVRRPFGTVPPHLFEF